MTLDQARKIIDEIVTTYGIEHSESLEKRKDGKIHFVACTVKFVIDGKVETRGPKKLLTKK